ncbi:MAG: N-acetylmuramoyl-L-alanine amidase family protein [Gemmatimonadaceae bacterium]
MIAALLLVFQIFTTSPSVLVVKNGTLEAVIPLEPTAAGPVFRPALLEPVFPSSFSQLSHGRFRLALAGAEIILADGVPFATVKAAGGSASADEQVVPLTQAPFVADGELYVPLHVASEITPRLGAGLAYDASRGELRAVIFRSRPPAHLSASAPAAGPGASSRVPRASPASPASPTPSAPPEEPPDRLVVVDAGHGGPDPGTHGTARGGAPLVEKEITLAVSRRLAAALESRGVETLMTRTADTLIALGDRGRIANAREGDLFISIHVNAANPRWRNAEEARGFETFFLAEAKTEDAKRVEQMENEAVRFETEADPLGDDLLSFIINDMAQNEHLRESNDLATTIQRHLARVHPGPNRGVKQAGFRVLVTAYMPAVLVEIGFATNREEAAFLRDPAKQRILAGAIADATMEYLGHYERRVGTTATP